MCILSGVQFVVASAGCKTVKAVQNKGERYTEIRNRKLRRDYIVGDKIEAGIVLTGTEVKSIRGGQAQINDAFVRIEKEKAVLYHAHVAEYDFGTENNHSPYRPRPLLLHKREIERLRKEIQSGGKTLVPSRLYFKKALIKVEIAVCVGKKRGDKREALKKKAEMRDAERALRRR